MFTTTIGEMLAVNMLPYRFVESRGFRHVVNKMVPEYQMPGRLTFSQKVIPDLYSTTKEKLKKELQEEFDNSGTILLNFTKITV